MERQKTPTLINLPPPDPYTPSDMPGTPNSTQTSLSAISTTAIKDGHTGQHGAGHRHHHHSLSNASETSTNTLDAERADRISRLAGLERVATVRQPSTNSGNVQASASNTQNLNTAVPAAPNALSAASLPQPQPVGYFDANGNPRILTTRSTVGSASATGSISMGGRTTWASGSTTTENEAEPQAYHDQEQDADGRSMSHMSVQDTNMSAAGDDPDEMRDVDAVSSAGLSDGGQESLVGFGEGANSTVSGPISAPRDPIQMARLRAAARLGMGNASPGLTGGIGMSGVERTGPSAQGIFGVQASGFGPVSSAPDSMEGVETAERIVRERLGQPEGGIHSPTDGKQLGKFPFEEH